MAENVNINVTENIDQVNIVASEVVEVVDLNLYATTEDVTINVTEEIIQVNINKVTASNVTKTSDLINDGEDGINPFITLEDIPPIDVSTLVPYTGATQNVDLGEFELKAGQLTLDTSPTGTAAVGTTRWNNTLGSSETTLKGGSVILKNGVDLVARVVNKVTPNTTLTKANYAAVRVSGAQGQRLAVAYAQANNDLNSTDTIGLVCETIPTNQEGFILTVGQLENINTTGNLQGENWNDGDVIYLSPTVAGKLTNIKPTAPQHIVIIGYVEYAHANNGKLYVKIMNGWELEELHNVTSTNYTTPIDADSVLTYDSTNSLWKRLTLANLKTDLTNIRRNAQSGNINYCGYAPSGSLENQAVWTITKITVATNGSVTTTTSNNVTWTSVPF
jgi:nitrogen fixation protein